MRKIYGVVVIGVLTSVLLSGCNINNSINSNTNDEKIQVYASFYAMYDFVREIGGDRVDVYNVCPPGSEPHDYEPTAAEMAKISSADVFVYNGMGMEHWTESVTDVLSGNNLLIVNTSDDIPNVYENGDPHVWLDPENAYAQMKSIADALILVDEENKDYYTDRLKECKAEIDEIDKEYADAVNGFSQKTVITSHAAYLSLCKAYGLEQYSVNGTDNSGDPTPSRMSEIENYIKSNGIKYIYAEPLSTNKVMKTISNDTGCEILTLDPFEGGTDKGYFDVMRENLDALKTGLR